MGDFIKACAISVICAYVYVIVLQVSPSLSFTVKLSGVVLIGGALIIVAESAISGIFLLVGADGTMGEYASTVIKALGIAMLSHLCADVCRDTGHASLANGVVLAAKLEIVILCLPMVEKIIGYASDIMNIW